MTVWVTYSCVRTISATLGTVLYDTACGGTVKYPYSYLGCSGAAQIYTYTYTITPPTFTVPADQGSTVACASLALTPSAPSTVTDNCGRTISATLGTVLYDTACGGTVKYPYSYLGCSGAAQIYTYTYTITPPTFTVPADQEIGRASCRERV